MIMIYRSTDSMIDLKMRVHRKFNSLGQITGIPSDWGNDKYYGSMIIYGNATKRRWKLILLFKTKNLVGDSDMNAPAVAVFFLSGSRYPRARSTHWAGGWAGCAPETYEWFRQLGSSSQIGWNSKTINQYIYIYLLISFYLSHESAIFVAELVIDTKQCVSAIALLGVAVEAKNILELNPKEDRPKQCVEQIIFLLEMALFINSISKTGDVQLHRMSVPLYWARLSYRTDYAVRRYTTDIPKFDKQLTCRQLPSMSHTMWGPLVVSWVITPWIL